MNEPTKICKTCGEEKSLSDFGVRKRNADGRNIHCIPCNRDLKQAAKKRREARMTPAQRDEAWKKKQASSTAYNEANREELARKCRVSRMRSDVPGMIENLRWLRRAVDAVSSDWSQWAHEMMRVKQEQYAVYPFGMRQPRDLAAQARMNADPVVADILKLRTYTDDLGRQSKSGGFRGEIRRIVERLDGFDGAELHEALTYVPKRRRAADVKGITPSDRRVLEKMADELSKKHGQSTERSIEEALRLADKFTLTDVYPLEHEVTFKDGSTKTYGEGQYVREERSSREFRLLQQQNGIMLAPVWEEAHVDDDEMTGLQNSLLQKKAEAEAAEEARIKRNADQRTRRAAKKSAKDRAEERRQQKRDSARRRRAEGRLT